MANVSRISIVAMTSAVRIYGSELKRNRTIRRTGLGNSETDMQGGQNVDEKEKRAYAICP